MCCPQAHAHRPWTAASDRHFSGAAGLAHGLYQSRALAHKRHRPNYP